MGTVIYSASPLKAFSGGIFLVLFLLGLGLVSGFSMIFDRRQKTIGRIGLGFAAVILLLAGVGSGIAMFLSFQNGNKTVVVKAQEKNEVTRMCNDNTYCTDYVVETSDGQKLYVFEMNKDVWEKIEIDACYQFTYYPAKSLLGDYLQSNEYQNLYETTGETTRIVVVNCP